MKVVVLEPGKAPEVVHLVERADDARLYALQQLVGGYIEIAMTIPLRGFEFVVYCNEEGLLRGLPFNCTRPTDGHPLVGTLVATVMDSNGNERDMTEREARHVMVIMTSLAASRTASLASDEN